MGLDEKEYLEDLLLAFDRLTSFTAFSRSEWPSTTAGLRSIESLLARISLGPSPETVDSADIAFPDATNPLFAWFLEFQDTFQGNTASQLVRFLGRLETVSSDGRDSERIRLFERWTRQSLQLLQGCLLLHEPSRSLFTRRPNMELLIRFLGTQYTGEVHVETVETTVSALVDRPDNLRVFEECHGLEAISKVFKDPKSSHTVKVKVLEFLYFYLIPETPPSGDPHDVDVSSVDSQQTTVFHGGDTIRPAKTGNGAGIGVATTRRHSREPATHTEDATSDDEQQPTWRTTTEKQAMLGKYFNNIDALVTSLNEFKPFGEI